MGMVWVLCAGIGTPDIGVKAKRGAVGGQPKRRKVIIDEQMVITSE